jgi:hypothetical protein
MPPPLPPTPAKEKFISKRGRLILLKFVTVFNLNVTQSLNFKVAAAEKFGENCAKTKLGKVCRYIARPVSDVRRQLRRLTAAATAAAAAAAAEEDSSWKKESIFKQKPTCGSAVGVMHAPLHSNVECYF